MSSVTQMRFRRLRLLFRVGALALTAVWLIGEVTRDRTWMTGLMFYIPSPFLTGVLWVAAIDVRLSRCQHELSGSLFQRRSFPWLMLSLAPLAMTLFVENQFTVAAPEANGQELRIVHWNVCRGGFDQTGLEDHLYSLQANLWVVSEVPAGFRSPEDKCSLRLPTMLLVSDFPITYVSDHSEGNYRAHLVTWHTPTGDLQIVVADLPAFLSVAREPLLIRLMKLVTDSGADLVIGDLNAPRRSRRLTQLPDGFRHGYEASGSGWSYTWPAQLPLLAIDHCIVGPRVIPVAYALDSTMLSDHRIQTIDVRFQPLRREGER